MARQRHYKITMPCSQSQWSLTTNRQQDHRESIGASGLVLLRYLSFPKAHSFRVHSNCLLLHSYCFIYTLWLFIFSLTSKAEFVKEQKHINLLGGSQFTESMDLWVILRSQNQERKWSSRNQSCWWTDGSATRRSCGQYLCLSISCWGFKVLDWNVSLQNLDCLSVPKPMGIWRFFFAFQRGTKALFKKNLARWWIF